MALFSQRIGKKDISKKIQREALDPETRSLLWSRLFETVLAGYTPRNAWGGYSDESVRIIQISRAIWMNYLKRPIDEMPEIPYFLAEVKSIILNGEWFDVLDLLEFSLKMTGEGLQGILKTILNRVLQAESCAYRFVDLEIVEITDGAEIESIETALADKRPYTQHLSKALDFLSDRKNQDYRNSIKESISAVESFCREVVGNPKATLGELIKNLKEKKPIHPAFESAMSKLYGYTSDESGIRHGLTEEAANPDYADAKYVLVLCTSFINFVKAKKSFS